MRVPLPPDSLGTINDHVGSIKEYLGSHRPIVFICLLCLCLTSYSVRPPRRGGTKRHPRRGESSYALQDDTVTMVAMPYLCKRFIIILPRP
jgi:hypothetical protein